MSEEQTTDTVIATGQSEQADPGVTFLDGLPEDLRSEPSLKNFTNAGDLAKSYLHAQRMVGADKIPVPGKHSTEEDWNMIYSRIGRPDDAAGYEIPGDKFSADDPAVVGFKEAAYKAGLNNSQANQILDYYSNLSQSQEQTSNAQIETSRKRAEEDLRKTYGLAFDKKIEMAQSVFSKYIPDELREKTFDGFRFGDHPVVIKALASIAENFTEDSATQENDLTLTPEDAEKEIAKLTAPGTPYWDKKHPGHQAAVEEVFQLQNAKHGIIEE